METAIVSLICIALLVFGGMTMSQGFLTSVDTSTMGLEEIGQRSETIMRTELSPLTARERDKGKFLEVTLENSGQTKLADFDKWDVIVQYTGDDNVYHVKWLPYTEETLGDNEWEVQWIRINGDPEVFEPDILNPGEEIMIKVRLNPKIKKDITDLVIISTPNGITASISFTR